MQRDRVRYFTSYMSVTVVYLLVGVFVYYAPSSHLLSSKKPKDTTIKISLSQFVPEVVPVSKPIVKKETLKEMPKKAVVKPIVKKPTPKIVKKRVKKKSKKKKSVKRTKKYVSKKQASKKQNHASRAKQSKFFGDLRRKIDNHKFYPRMAKKRGIEGIVSVKFTILPNGRVGNIEIKGPKIFHHSARDAIKSAFPLNVKDIPVSLPVHINIGLHYLIR